jgi:ergothioneine biosynthesis protein EgtB
VLTARAVTKIHHFCGEQHENHFLSENFPGAKLRLVFLTDFLTHFHTAMITHRSSSATTSVAMVDSIQSSLRKDFTTVRAATLEICQPLAIEDYVIQTAPFMSPPRWHLGHTSWFFEMLLTRFMPEYKVYSEAFLFYFNSYYEGFGARINRQKRGAVSRPTVQETMLYRSRVDGHIQILLERLPHLAEATEAARLLRLGLEHEMQHQELLVYDIKNLLMDEYKPVTLLPMPNAVPHLANHDNLHGSLQSEIRITGGIAELGANADENTFAWDNEMPRHKTYLQDYAIDKRLVTNAEYLEFMRSGAYTDYRWWLSSAWEWLKTDDVHAPMYWERVEQDEGSAWHIRDYRGLRSADNNEPVAHISYYEAAAYAKWVGKRLPTEAEWEHACTFDPAVGRKMYFPWGDQEGSSGAAPLRANLFENRLWCPAEAGSFAGGVSPLGAWQMIGDLWEWTSSDYAPYPGFTSHFDEYNDKWFIGQKVMRGGSYATPTASIRATYRNFFNPQERWMTSGFRCARTV